MSATIHYIHARAARHRVNWSRIGWRLFAVAWCFAWWVGAVQIALVVKHWLAL